MEHKPSCPHEVPPPDPEELRRRCEAIQRGWDAETEWKRRAVKPTPAFGFHDCYIAEPDADEE